MSATAVSKLPILIDGNHVDDLLVRREKRLLRRVRRRVRVAVVGGGVAGLSAARELLALGVDVTVIEDRDIRATVSWLAAGLIEPVAGTRDPAGLARELAAFARSMNSWRDLARTGSPLISRRQVLTVCSASRPPLPWADAVDGFRPVPAAELHADYANGEAATFATYVVETHRWLMATRARLAYSGVRFVRAHLDDLDEAAVVGGPVDGIVNASGLGAASLAADATLYRGDGHVIRIAPVAGVSDVFMDETWTPGTDGPDPFDVNMLYIIPRRYDIVVGGTLHDSPDVQTDPKCKPGMAAHLLRLASRIEPRLAHARVLSYHVGARPRRREGVRVELDVSGDIPVVHCYGQGGSGWTLAPALAENAVGFVADAVWARAAAEG